VGRLRRSICWLCPDRAPPRAGPSSSSPADRTRDKRGTQAREVARVAPTAQLRGRLRAHAPGSSCPSGPSRSVRCPSSACGSALPPRSPPV
jgi:hypothetical protein